MAPVRAPSRRDVEQLSVASSDDSSDLAEAASPELFASKCEQMRGKARKCEHFPSLLMVFSWCFHVFCLRCPPES